MPKLGDIWGPFHRSQDKPNGAHNRATHLRCILTHKPESAPIDVDTDLTKNIALIENEPWFPGALRQSAAIKKEYCNGEKTTMAAHLRRCPNSTAAEKALAAEVAPTKEEKLAAEKKVKEAAAREKRKRQGQDDSDQEADDEGAGQQVPTGKKRRKIGAAVEKAMSQSKLQGYRGVDMPFSKDQAEAIADQFLRATQSANLPERWVDDVEVIKLLLMMRSCALDVIPSRGVLGGTLLERASNRVDGEIHRKVHGEDVMLNTDGWRSNARDNVAGIQLNWKFQTLLVDILRTNRWKKDGESLSIRFAGMIDSTEEKLGCIVRGFLTDNDGGSKRGRNLLQDMRQWLMTFPCVAHQGQLILGDYFKECPEAAELAEELIEFVNWLNNHDKIREIFDDQQRANNGLAQAYILANLTRWTTHLVAFLRFRSLKTPIRTAILNDRDKIIAAQVGVEANRRKAEALRADAISHCESVESNTWWDRLDVAIADIEHICYLTNIAQSDHVRPDQFLLALGGLFLHFRNHKNKDLGKRMCKRIEKRWKELDQVVFILALVFNPFQGVSRFGDKANVDAFILCAALVKLFERVHSRPPATPRSVEEEAAYKSAFKTRTQNLHTSGILYLSKTGSFASWNEEDSLAKGTHVKLHGEDPIPFWDVFKANTQVCELATFVQMLLYLVVNQAGLERTFSDFSNKKCKKRARLSLKKMAQQSKVTRAIREEQRAEGLYQTRDGRKNHDERDIWSLLPVPRYAEAAALSDTDGEEGTVESVLIRSKAAWRKQLSKWQEGMQEIEDLSDDELPPTAAPPKATRAPRSWLPITLEALFGGQVANPIKLKRRRQATTEESRLMELLAAEHSDEEPDAGAMEGSGDDYEE
ncbi:ribonuclease H-like domain-containing protein [Mycena amicta]|nr:ribonuclease H-like domain-containing protein [Mycena amicta]KAJ7049227.1 ribonuclease H-like domain-containing protein [Mycena amicta]KAJ7055014.1 ribonuclease H-like domain-containing protein [Mycena amicta]